MSKCWISKKFETERKVSKLWKFISSRVLHLCTLIEEEQYFLDNIPPSSAQFFAPIKQLT